MITRTYRCLDCNVIFECDHDSGDEPEPPCPQCDVTLQWQPKSFNIGTSKGKAVDVAQQILEQDYGISNFRDNMREGDTAVVAQPESKETQEARGRHMDDVRSAAASSDMANKPEVQAALKTFFGSGGTQQVNLSGAMSGTKMGPEAYTADNNPMSMLHRAGQKGLLPTGIRVVGRG